MPGSTRTESCRRRPNCEPVPGRTGRDAPIARGDSLSIEQHLAVAGQCEVRGPISAENLS